jgi:hypothetical protein
MEAVARGHAERLPSGSWRAVVYAGADPLTGKEIYLKATTKIAMRGTGTDSLTTIAAVDGHLA